MDVLWARSGSSKPRSWTMSKSAACPLLVRSELGGCQARQGSGGLLAETGSIEPPDGYRAALATVRTGASTASSEMSTGFG
jgi:hypothetical protein